MANVINRTTRDSAGALLYHASVNTPDYDTNDWLVNPDLSGVSGVEPYYWKVTGAPPGGDVEEMDAGEKTAVDTARLAAAKAARKTALETEGDSYLAQRYPAGVVTQLGAVYIDAVRDRPERGAYLRPWIEWREKISAEVKAKQDDADAASTVSAVNAVELP